MRRALAWALGAAVVAGLGLLLLPSEPEADREARAERPAGEPRPEDAAETRPARRSVLEKVASPKDAETSVEVTREDEAERAPSPWEMEVTESAPALSGLELSAVGAADRDRLEVPDEYGSGVVIEDIHPDAPAAEAGLRPGDVIVRAMRDDVDSVDDLSRVVGQRGHTVLIAVRNGEYMELVIQKPYDGS
jgi:membrane-associated protease RseP (regulator of RpoE activity)